ncbi:MAG: 30S ribosomal protein S16, partial [Chryseobacterium sp.]
GKVEGLSKAQSDAKKAALDAEVKVNEARVAAAAQVIADAKAAEEAANAPAEEVVAEATEGEAPAAETTEENTEA